MDIRKSIKPLLISTMAVLLVFFILASMSESEVLAVNTQEGGQVFVDVFPGLWFYNDVGDVYARGIMRGVPGDPPRFMPDAPMTRAQFAAVLFRTTVLMSGAQSAANLPNPFADVDEGVWYTRYALWAADNSLIIGRPSGYFDPHAYVTKEELATAFYRWQISENHIPPSTIDAVWPDTDEISAWAYESVMALTTQGLFSYWPHEMFDPQSPATRAEMASILHWLF